MVAAAKSVVVNSMWWEEKNAKKIIINNRAVHQHRIIIADWLPRTRARCVCSHSFLFFSFFSFSLFLVRERRSSLYILSSLFSLLGFFLLLHPIAATYMQTFSSRCLLPVGQAFLFVVAPVSSARSFARAAIASPIHHSFSFFFLASRFFFCWKPETNQQSCVSVCLYVYYFYHILEVYT